MTRLILASRSPARLQTLRAAGIEPEVIVSDVDEEAIEAGLADATPKQLAGVLARAKAEKVASTIAQRPDTNPTLIIGCDSVFELDGIAYGKPQTPEVAKERWRQMMGRAGTLHTGHHVIDTRTNKTATATASTLVHMGTMSEQEMDDYLASGEPLQVAGGFTLDALGGAFVEGVEGDPSNVVGISLPTLRRLLGELGVGWTSLWNRTPTDPSSPR
jgi:septum formation protein